MANEAEPNRASAASEEVSDRVLTVPNVISFLRLLMAPAFLVLLYHGNDMAAALLFGFAAATDFVDGQIARRTHQVSRLGQVLDPAVDRILMICAVLGALATNRLPIWIVILVLARDALLLTGGWFLLHEYKIRVAVVYAGKIATTLLFFGLFGLLLNTPLVDGLGWCDVSWLPGFTHEACSWGIWFVYVGLIIGVFTTSYYVLTGIKGLKQASLEKEEDTLSPSEGGVL